MSLFPQGNFGRKRKAQNNSPDGGLQGQVPRDKCVSQAAPPQASSFPSRSHFLELQNFPRTMEKYVCIQFCVTHF